MSLPPDLHTLHLGIGWLPEHAGGVERYFQDLWRASDGVFGFSGLVFGSDLVAAQTAGQIRAATRMDAGAFQRARALRAAMTQALAQTKPHVIVSHFAATTWPVLNLIKAPMVLHFHGPWALEAQAEGQGWLRSRLKRQIEAQTYRRAGRAVVLSQAFADILARQYHYPADKIDIIPGGVDTTRFAPTLSPTAARAALGWPQDRPIVLAVRRLVQRMGLETLIDAAARLKQSHKEPLILIAGRGPLAGSLQARITALGLKHHVKLLGFLPEAQLPLAYRAADLGIIPTAALEGFGLIALETLACGTPVLVTPVGGLPEAVTGLSPDLILPSTTAQDMAQGLAQALYSAKLPDAAQCQAHAAQFDWGQIAPRLAASYRKALVS